jgi:hypothetical protein
MADKIPPTEEAQTADTQDGGWDVESHSAPSDPAPLDTTAASARVDSSARPPAKVADAEGEGEEIEAAEGNEAEEGEEDGDHVSRSADPNAAARARDDKTGQFVKPAKKASPKKRIGELTWQAKEAERRADRAAAENLSLRERLDALEKAGKPAAEPAKVAAVSTAEMPEPPNYPDFATDEEFKTAQTKWRAELAKWQDERLEARTAAFRGEVTKDVDAKLTKSREEADLEKHQAAVLARIETAKAAHPDWNEKAPNLQAVESAWYDKERHGEARTPFLSDLVANNEQGPELLYWLMSNPEAAQIAADLFPSRPLRDALVHSPLAHKLIEYFTTEDGEKDFVRLRAAHPLRVAAEIGQLELRMETAARGPAPARVAPITAAVPPAKPPVGSQRARDPQGSANPTESFDSWMEAEDKREKADKLRAAGVSA